MIGFRDAAIEPFLFFCVEESLLFFFPSARPVLDKESLRKTPFPFLVPENTPFVLLLLAQSLMERPDSRGEFFVFFLPNSPLPLRIRAEQFIFTGNREVPLPLFCIVVKSPRSFSLLLFLGER